MMEVITIAVTDFACNAHIVHDAASKQAVLIDPGGDIDLIINELQARNLTLAAVLITHAHLDHAGGVVFLNQVIESKGWAVPKLYAHVADRELRESITKQAQMFGMDEFAFQNCPEPDVYLADEATVAVDKLTLKALHTPGHAPGHLCFYVAGESPVLFAGDALFKGSIGRTDLPGGNSYQLLHSITAKLLTLPENTVVYPGHGEATTILREKYANPYVKVMEKG